LLPIFLLAVADEPKSNKADEKAALEAIERIADKMESEMSPEERRKFHENVERSATAEMQATANNCGTSLVFSQEPRFEDRTVWTAPGSSAEQTVCVQRTYPFVKGHGS
jgi:hypothetical protein